MIIIKDDIVRIVECWFGEEPIGPADIIVYRQMPQRIPGGNCQVFNTLLIDLGKDPEQLLAAMKKDTRNCIRRADTRDNLVYEWEDNPSSEMLAEFSDFYDEFARSKGISLAASRRMEALLPPRRLALSRVCTQDGSIIVWHSLHVGQKRVRDIIRASTLREAPDAETRQMMGRANRYLTYRDLLKAKELGKTEYDVGGWYTGTTDESLLKVNAFKAEFGGTLVEEYDGIRAQSPKGRLYLRARRLKHQLLGR